MLKPMYLFGLWGVAFFAAAFGFSVWTLYMRTKGYFFTATPLPMMAVFSFMTGVICILMGLLAEMITRTFLRVPEQVDLSRARNPQPEIVSEGGLKCAESPDSSARGIGAISNA